MHVVLEGDFPKGAAGLLLDWNNIVDEGLARSVDQRQVRTFGQPAARQHAHREARRRARVTPAQAFCATSTPRPCERVAVWMSFWNPGELLFGPVGAKLLPVDRLDVDAARAGPVPSKVR